MHFNICTNLQCNSYTHKICTIMIFILDAKWFALLSVYLKSLICGFERIPMIFMDKALRNHSINQRRLHSIKNAIYFDCECEIMSETVIIIAASGCLHCSFLQLNSVCKMNHVNQIRIDLMKP